MSLKSEARYKGAQNLLSSIGKEGCYVLCLLSIAEDASGREYDVLNVVRDMIKWGVVKEDMYVVDAERFLSLLTGHTWKKLENRVELGEVADDEYTIEKYRKGSLTHFRRRPYDVYTNSATVATGEFVCYYVFKECK